MLLEIENGSQNLKPDSFAQEAIRIPYDLPPKERDNIVYGNRWGVLGGDIGGLFDWCEPGGIDPWGPYFGRDLYPNSGPLWW